MEKAMHWYLVHTKPRQEACAQQNLERQGYKCYLPLLQKEKVRQGSLTIEDEALFPRYLFIRLDPGASGKSWAPIRSTKGVSRLVSFGSEPAKISDDLILAMQTQQQNSQQQPQRAFEAGQRVRLVTGVFSGIEGIFQEANGERRVMVLIEMLSNRVSIAVAPDALRKIV
ncbi:transcription/translation regulatory transformer protein RfaH [Herbaspirillum chlorophenolicum]|uniref:Transcription antitermination protein RfaH n=1 Tax=Herbaspirillum chlorophenolicum TaxID=211589 RepID=A0ABW8ES92_9BURK